MSRDSDLARTPAERAARFRRRLADVRALRARRARRDRWFRIGGAAIIAVVPAAVGLAALELAGLLIGLAVSLVVFGGIALAGRLARRRGASAWDWQLGRHRLIGDPSRRVKELDEREQ